MNTENTKPQDGGAVSSLSSSDMLDDIGLANLLRYIINPRKYVSKALIKDNPTNDDLEDYEAWAASRARHILEALSSNERDVS